MNDQFDVIIIGAGPSGASCAYNLKRFNPHARVLLIEKTKFPRYKTCGGGISPEVLNYLDFDLSDVIDYTCTEAVMVANKKQISTPIDEVFMVRREDFDNLLLNKAQSLGVQTLMECEVVDVERSDIWQTVKTKTGAFTAKVVVIAEGSRGKLARKLNIDPKNQVWAAMEYEHYTTNLDGKLYIDFDYNNDGYAWNFPKSDGLSMGIGGRIKGQDKGKVGLPKKLKNFIHQFKINEAEQKHVHGHPIQLYSGRKKLAHGPILLIGEIAGCVDPLTAEGIRPAIKSGYLAAQVLAEAIRRNKFKDIKKYNKLFHKHIGKDFQYARIMSYFVNNYRKAILPHLSSQKVLIQFMSVFSGKSTYRNKVSLKRIVKMISKVAWRSKLNTHV